MPCPSARTDSRASCRQAGLLSSSMRGIPPCVPPFQVLRLYPAIPIFPRQAAEADTLPSGHRILKGVRSRRRGQCRASWTPTAPSLPRCVCLAFFCAGPVVALLCSHACAAPAPAPAPAARMTLGWPAPSPCWQATSSSCPPMPSTARQTCGRSRCASTPTGVPCMLRHAVHAAPAGLALFSKTQGGALLGLPAEPAQLRAHWPGCCQVPLSLLLALTPPAPAGSWASEALRCTASSGCPLARGRACAWAPPLRRYTCGMPCL